MTRTIRAPRGATLTCKNWLIEAAYRMIQNNLDPEVAFDPDHLIVYGGRGRAARNWECYDAILASLRDLEPDETLLVQSGKPVVVFKTHEDAPRVLIANSNIVPHWATQENFDKWEAEGLIMFGQMTAGSWIYIGTQGILQGTYETFGALARQHGWGTLKGKLVLTAGLGEMGGAQPLAVTMNEGVVVAVEVDQWRIDRRLAHRYLDVATDNLEEAMTWAEEAKAKGEAKSIGLLGNAAEVLPELVAAGLRAGRGHRSDQRARSADRLHPGGDEPGGSCRVACARSAGVPGAGDGEHGGARRGDAGVSARRQRGVRLRQ